MSHPIPMAPPGAAAAGAPDLICLSHLRWNFVFQRPQHLMTRCRADRRVYFFEEPVFDASAPWLALESHEGVRVVVPHLPPAGDDAASAMQRELLDELMAAEEIASYVLWYYTPMAVRFTDHLSPRAVVYDCMDELSAFANAPAGLKACERRLLARAALVLTGGWSLYEAKRSAHANVHAFPSSVDVPHFARARTIQADPSDQAAIPRPRLGFFGVIDERLDVPLLAGIAERRPDWHLMLLGPTVKIDPAILPRHPNIHYLGARSYAELPHYLAGWDVATIPFARNEATRYISPTKTPEYLAAGVPVVSTSIRDVVRPYLKEGLVRIADDPDRFVEACEQAMREDPAARRRRADAFLRQTSWDGTWTRIRILLDRALSAADGSDAGGAIEAVAGQAG